LTYSGILNGILLDKFLHRKEKTIITKFTIKPAQNPLISLSSSTYEQKSFAFELCIAVTEWNYRLFPVY